MKFSLRSLFSFSEKLNPAQENIVDDFGTDNPPAVEHRTNQQAYKIIESVNRGTNLIVDSAAGLKIDVGDILDFSNTPQRIRKKKLNTLLNFRPNPYYNADTFKRLVYIDLILEGDAFIYFDGAHMYHLPALRVECIADKVTYIKEYRYDNKVFKPNEIIHIKENSGDNIFTGTSRLDAAKKSMELLLSMTEFQQSFFTNSAVPGLVLTTPNPLSERVKSRIISQWVQRYKPSSGGRRPMIIDGDFKVEPLSKTSFSEMDFNESVKTQNDKILHALGVPPILLDSGNNANITPNLKLFYITNVLPLVEKVTAAMENHFGYDLKPIVQDSLALRPELKDLSNYLTTLVNAGVITRNEARIEIRYSEHTSEIADDLILPANIAGSALDSNVGGAPEKGKEETNDKRLKTSNKSSS